MSAIQKIFLVYFSDFYERNKNCSNCIQMFFAFQTWYTYRVNRVFFTSTKIILRKLKSIINSAPVYINASFRLKDSVLFWLVCVMFQGHQMGRNKCTMTCYHKEVVLLSAFHMALKRFLRSNVFFVQKDN